MASPKLEVFFFYSATTGVPLTGLTPTFDTYKDHTGADLAQPAITEIGGGAYAFTPIFTPNFGIVYIVNAGSTAAPQRVSRYMRPEDWNLDNADIPTSDVASFNFAEASAIMTGNWTIHTFGPDANRMVITDPDDDTVIAKYNLYDKNGLPTYLNPFSRTRIP